MPNDGQVMMLFDVGHCYPQSYSIDMNWSTRKTTSQCKELSYCIIFQSKKGITVEKELGTYVKFKQPNLQE